MKFIKPSEVSSKIMTLMDESDKFVLLVSPYIKITKWYKFLKKLENVKSRNVSVEFIIRDDKNNHVSFQELNDLKIDFKAIPDLHCKLYLNEKYAIVSSMNLLLSSEIRSLELAYSTETEKEYEELTEFCKRYLNVHFDNTNINYQSAIDIIDWRNHALDVLTERLGKRVHAQEENGAFLINTSTNNYNCFIWNSKQNILRISGILSGKEYEFLKSQPDKYPKAEGIYIEIQKGGNGHYDTIWGSSKTSMKSNDINNLNENENVLVAEQVINFILAIDDFKNGQPKI